ncbi:MAG: class I SAM-dependent methyltransferase [Acidobacteria bacterium]|nr:class I SAM-dependent methyltransferase [Acidobacteriota bacterium]
MALNAPEVEAVEAVWGENGVMRPSNYEVLFDVEDAHWWFVGRRAIVFALIEQALGTPLGTHRFQRAASASDGIKASVPTPDSFRQLPSPHAGSGAYPGQILDIGCGTGATMDHLQRFGTVQGIDLFDLPLRFSRQRGHQRVLCASATELPFATSSFDLVTALDVIEHLDDDVGGLREIRRVLKPGAPAVIFVPAFQALWGPNDVQSGHKRRYRLPQLQTAVAAAGLKIEKISYANLAMFAPIWLGRRLLTLLGQAEQAENRINHPFINGVIAKLFASEAGWLRHHSLPFGVSLICVMRKAE